MSGNEQSKAIAHLRSPQTIRTRCQAILAEARGGRLRHFALVEERLDAVAAYVYAEMIANYPSGQIPYHSRYRHLEAGGVDRLERLRRQLAGVSPRERGESLGELVILSVLLDAGAGMAWQYREARTGQVYRRSEGLAVASFAMFGEGFFSSVKGQPLQADAEGLAALGPSDLARGLQVGGGNPLVGLEGRASLLNRLAREMQDSSRYFGDGKNPRLARLFDGLATRAQPCAEGGLGRLHAGDVLALVLDALAPIWPNGYQFAGLNLGDIGRHPAARGPHGTEGLVPFHKLSQWLTYSLLEPLAEMGYSLVGVEALTGLPEYRNGGLLLDLGLLTVKDPQALTQRYKPDSEFIVEWRALTVALLDEVAAKIRAMTGQSEEELPLAKILQGGTWSAGRKAALARRSDGGPPLQIDSDGTVF